TVRPQVSATLEITSGAFPVFSNLKTCSTLSPCVMSPKSLEDSSKVITGPSTVFSCAWTEMDIIAATSKIKSFLILVLIIYILDTLFNVKLRIKVHHKQLPGGPGHGGVQPADVFPVQLLLGKITLIHENRLPLSSLRLVAGEGISELDL